jgi:trehalose synthase
MLDDPALAERMGTAAHEHVRANYVGDLHLLRYAELFGSMLAAEQGAATAPAARFRR